MPHRFDLRRHRLRPFCRQAGYGMSLVARRAEGTCSIDLTCADICGCFVGSRLARWVWWWGDRDWFGGVAGGGEACRIDFS